jgi:amino acid transporter
VPWACANQAHWTLHAVAALAFALALSLTALCVINWRKTLAKDRGQAGDSADPSVRDGFLALMGALISGYCALAIAAQWATQLVLSPCVL